MIAIGAPRARAQSESDDFMDDDEPFDEPVDDKNLQRGQGPRQRGPSVPTFNKNGTAGADKNNPDVRPPAPSNPINTGDVAFRLIDPPKLWQPKKRRHRNRADDKKVSVKREAEIKDATQFERDKNSSSK